MGAQSLNLITLEVNRQKLEDKMVEEGENYLYFKHYHLGEPVNERKLIHIQALHKAHSTENCNVQNFIKKQLEPKHEYLELENERKCEEFDICYNYE